MEECIESTDSFDADDVRGGGRRFSLGFSMRQLTGVGTPRSLQGRVRALLAALSRPLPRLIAFPGGYWVRSTTPLHQLDPAPDTEKQFCHGLLLIWK